MTGNIIMVFYAMLIIVVAIGLWRLISMANRIKQLEKDVKKMETSQYSLENIEYPVEKERIRIAYQLIDALSNYMGVGFERKNTTCIETEYTAIKKKVGKRH